MSLLLYDLAAAFLNAASWVAAARAERVGLRLVARAAELLAERTRLSWDELS